MTLRLGQVLYLEHSVESLARVGPWLLGTIVPGISRWRVLREAETEMHGGSSRRRLYGCTVTMVHAQMARQATVTPAQSVSCAGPEMMGIAGGGALGPSPPVFEQLLLTWSQVTSTVATGLSGQHSVTSASVKSAMAFSSCTLMIISRF
jgi:hypothetical protein